MSALATAAVILPAFVALGIGTQLGRRLGFIQGFETGRVQGAAMATANLSGLEPLERGLSDAPSPSEPWKAWPPLPIGATWSTSPIDLDGVALTLTGDALIRLRVDPEGRLSATGRPLFLRIAASPRGGHAA